jgi:hypothetical protein
VKQRVPSIKSGSGRWWGEKAVPAAQLVQTDGGEEKKMETRRRGILKENHNRDDALSRVSDVFFRGIGRESINEWVDECGMKGCVVARCVKVSRG